MKNIAEIGLKQEQIARYLSGTSEQEQADKKVVREDRAIAKALKILQKRLEDSPSVATVSAFALTASTATTNYLKLELGEEKNECFCVLFLDNQHRLLKFERMFHGTIDGASVHPRVVAQRALELNSAAVIFAHNHPSTVTEPSNADRQITDKLQSALDLVETRVLDHVIIGGDQYYSFAEHGLIHN